MKLVKPSGRRYAIRYYLMVRDVLSRAPMAQGYTDSLAGARGTAARHLARDDYYPKAAIVDRHSGRLLLVMSRTKDGIQIKEMS